MPAWAQGSGEAGRPVESARATLARWMETQQIISKEKKDWQIGKEVLEQRISLIENEIAALEAKVAEARSGIGEADTKRQELLKENDALKEASSALESVIGRLEGKARRMVASLPDPIRERVQPLSQRIPKDPASTGLSLGERYQNVVGVLNEVNKFNRDVTVTSEIRSLPDGSSAEVRAMYIGLGQGYYVTTGGELAGVGRPGPDGWEWAAANDMAAEIARAIAILQNESVPAYVPLPVTIQ
jgi:hypothetical protein